MADTNELGGFIQSLRAWPEQPEIVGLVRLAGLAQRHGHERDVSTGCADELVESLDARAAGRRRAAGAARGDGRRRLRRTSKARCCAAVREVVGPADSDRGHARPARQRDRADGRIGRRPGAVPHGPAHRRVRDRPARRAACCGGFSSRAPGRSRPFRRSRWSCPPKRANTQDPDQRQLRLSRATCKRWNASRACWPPGWPRCSPGSTFPSWARAWSSSTDGDADLADGLCRELAQCVWRRRRDYLPELVPVDEAVRRAHEHVGRAGRAQRQCRRHHVRRAGRQQLGACASC